MARPLQCTVVTSATRTTRATGATHERSTRGTCFTVAPSPARPRHRTTTLSAKGVSK